MHNCQPLQAFSSTQQNSCNFFLIFGMNNNNKLLNAAGIGPGWPENSTWQTSIHLLLLQVIIEPLDKLLSCLVHFAVLVDVLQWERRVRYPQLPHHGAPAEPRKRRRRHLAVQHLQHRLDGVHGGEVIVGGWRRLENTRKDVVVVVFSFVEVEGKVVRIRGAVAAAELVLTWCSEGDVAVSRAAGGGGAVVVEHEVPDGFSGDLAALHHHVEIEQQLSLWNAFSEHEEHHTYYAP